MPFIAECPYCKRGKIRAPDKAQGWSAVCPNPDCASAFMLMPMEKPPSDQEVAAKIEQTAHAAATNGKVGSSPRLFAAPHAATYDAEPDNDPTAPRMRYPLVTVLAFFLGSVALLCASLPIVDAAAIPVGALGIVLGLVAMLLANHRGKGMLFASIGLVVGVLALAAGLWPSLVDPKSGLSQEEPAPNLAKVVGPQKPGSASTPPPPETEWVDATNQLQIGDVWFRIKSASVEFPELRVGAKQEFFAEPCLVLRVEVTNVGATRRLEYESWASTAQAKSKHVPKLKDQRGREFRQKVVPGNATLVGHTGKAAIAPGKWVEDILLFEPPMTQENLRLELPSSAYGCEGSLKIEIPRGMIKRR